MTSSSTSANIAKFIVFLIGFVLFLFLLYWLWQRQPKTELQKKVENKIETIQSAIEKDESDISPPTASVLSEKEIKIDGKTSPSSFVAIYSNSFQALVDSDQNGNFSSNFELEEGLNQIKIAAFAKTDLSPASTSDVTYYLKNDKEKLPENSLLYAGSVKSIFDTILNIATGEGDKKTVTKKTTEMELPEDEEEKSATASALSAVRIGDFAIALGTIDKEKTMTTQKLIIIREDKPQVEREVAVVKILKEPKSNLFSTNNLKDNKIIEFSLNKESEIVKENKEADAKSITKEKKALIIYRKVSDKNIVTLVYLIP